MQCCGGNVVFIPIEIKGFLGLILGNGHCLMQMLFALSVIVFTNLFNE